MAILLLYGSTRDDTREIVISVAARLAEAGRHAVPVDAADVPDEIEIDAFEAVIVAAALDADGYPPAVVQFVAEHHAVLAGRPSAFVSVSAAAASDDPGERGGLVREVVRFRAATDWNPTLVAHVSGVDRAALAETVDRFADGLGHLAVSEPG